MVVSKHVMKENKMAEEIFLQHLSHEIFTDLNMYCLNNIRIQGYGGNRTQHLQ
jgi:hypothetical protein